MTDAEMISEIDLYLEEPNSIDKRWIEILTRCRELLEKARAHDE